MARLRKKEGKASPIPGSVGPARVPRAFYNRTLIKPLPNLRQTGQRLSSTGAPRSGPRRQPDFASVLIHSALYAVLDPSFIVRA